MQLVVPRPHRRVARLAPLLALAAACADPAGPPPATSEPLVAAAGGPSVTIADTAGTPRARLGLDRLSLAGGVFGAGLAPVDLRELDHVRWSPDGRAVAAVASRPSATQSDEAAVVLVLDAGGDSARTASIRATHAWSVDWAPDGRRLAYAFAVATSARATSDRIGVTELGGAPRVLLRTDSLNLNGFGRIPEAVRWGAGGEVYFAIWRRDLYGEEPRGTVSTLYAVDATTARARVLRDSVLGRVAEFARDGDRVLLLRTPRDDRSPPALPDYRTLVRLDLATGREQVLVDGPRVRWARLTARDERVLVAVNVDPNASGTRLEYRVLTPDGRLVGTVAGPARPTETIFVWGSRHTDLRLP